MKAPDPKLGHAIMRLVEIVRIVVRRGDADGIAPVQKVVAAGLVDPALVHQIGPMGQIY